MLAWDLTWEEIERLRKSEAILKSNGSDEIVAPAQFESLAVETQELAKLFEAAGEPEVIRTTGKVVKVARQYKLRDAIGELNLNVDHTQVHVAKDLGVWISGTVKARDGAERFTDVVVTSEPMPVEKLAELAGFKAKQAA
ncbi:MAG: hypothetical protein EPN36_13890 [Rhodanobacteraceae bacterium]|nr:MAG: hypothetical protein EPN36_13890 [Rhodanobacteraceae bacterium]